MNPFQSIYELIGEDRIRLLTRLLYRGVSQHSNLRKLYSDDLAPAERRLFMFPLQVFGGSQNYSVERCHPRIRQRHFDWRIGPDIRDQWFSSALTFLDKLYPNLNAKELMSGKFIKVANHMINHE